MFGTGTKDTGYDAVGLDAGTNGGRPGARRADIPVVAIGGITLDTAPAVLDAGAASVCVISDLLKGDPLVRARQYLAALGSRSPER